MALSGSRDRPVQMGGFGQHIVRYVRPPGWGSIDLNPLDEFGDPDAPGDSITGPSASGDISGSVGITAGYWQHVGDVETDEYTGFYLTAPAGPLVGSGFFFIVIGPENGVYDPSTPGFRVFVQDGAFHNFNSNLFIGFADPPFPASMPQRKGWVFCGGSAKWDVIGASPVQNAHITLSVANSSADQGPAGDFVHTAEWDQSLGQIVPSSIPLSLVPWEIRNNNIIAGHPAFATGLVVLSGYTDLTVPANLNKLRGLCSGGATVGARDPTKGAAPLSPALFMYGNKDQFAQNRIDGEAWTPSIPLVSGPTLRVCQGA